MKDDILNYAMKLGATDAKIIPTADVMIENRVVLKCKYRCREYGMNWSCPPFVPSVEEFRSIMKEYKYAMVAKFQSSAKVSGTAVGTHGDAIRELDDFYGTWNEDKRKATVALLELEKFAFNKGFTFALGLRAGACTLCSKCDITKPCVHPEMLRFAPEAVGVNLVGTLKNVGLALDFPVGKDDNNSASLVMMLLIT